MSEILTHKEPLDHSLNDEGIHDDDFFLPNQNEALSGKERASDTSEQAHQFADEMEKLGVRTKVLEARISHFQIYSIHLHLLITINCLMDRQFAYTGVYAQLADKRLLIKSVTY